MSHTTTIRSTPIRDRSALVAAVKTLIDQGALIELKENVVPRMYYREQEQDIGICPYVIKTLDGRYDVGFREENGALVPVFDEFGGDISKHLGLKNRDLSSGEQCIAKLTTEIAKQTIINAAIAAGHMIESIEQTNNGGWNVVVATN